MEDRGLIKIYLRLDGKNLSKIKTYSLNTGVLSQPKSTLSHLIAMPSMSFLLTSLPLISSFSKKFEILADETLA